MPPQTWTFKSSSGPATYTTQLDEYDCLSCNCRGYTFKRPNKPRDCKHTKEVARVNGFVTEIRGEYVYVVATDAVQQPLGGPGVVTEGAPPPDLPAPMLATKIPDNTTLEALIASDEFLMEEKLDGHRCVVTVLDGTVEAWSRPRAGEAPKGRSLSGRIVKALRRMPDGIYDGEVIIPGGKSSDVKAAAFSDKSVLVLFDVLRCEGVDAMELPYEIRRNGLIVCVKAALATSGENPLDVPLKVILNVPPSMADIEKIWAGGGEGAVLKRKGSTYTPGWRSPDWIKVKKVAAETLTIIGFVAGKSGPYSTVKLRSKDGLETTVKTLDNATFRAIEADPQAFIGKRLVISFQEKLASGLWRHPMWDHLAGESE